MPPWISATEDAALRKEDLRIFIEKGRRIIGVPNDNWVRANDTA
jgi:hypothetical protein